jgi:hypothetical protein
MSDISRKYKIRNILAESNAHALPHLVGEKNRCLKVIWFASFLLSIGACFYFLNKTLNDYFSYTKVTSIDIISEQPATFPTVTICNRKEHDLITKNITLCQINYDKSCQNNPEIYFDSFTDIYYGKCLRFNSGKNGFIQRGFYGSSNDGLHLNFKLNSTDRFGKLLVIIHNHTIPPLNMANEDIKISPGRTYYIKVHRTFSQKLGQPYSDCLSDLDLFKKNKTIINFLNESGRQYSQRQCFELCFSIQYYDTNPCNCTNNPWEDVFAKCYATVEKYSPLYNCSQNYRTKFSKKSFEQKCSNYCPLECNSIEYSLSTYTLNYPSSGNISKQDVIKHFGDRFFTYEDLQFSFFSMVIYYKDLKYTLIKEEPNMVLTDLVSNTGGLLGIFIGYSLVSFMEVIELVIACLKPSKINLKQTNQRIQVEYIQYETNL